GVIPRPNPLPDGIGKGRGAKTNPGDPGAAGKGTRAGLHAAQPCSGVPADERARERPSEHEEIAHAAQLAVVADSGALLQVDQVAEERNEKDAHRIGIAAHQPVSRLGWHSWGRRGPRSRWRRWSKGIGIGRNLGKRGVSAVRPETLASGKLRPGGR